MRLKANIFLLIIITALLLTHPASPSEKSPYYYKDQSEIIHSILNNEKSINNLKNIIDIIIYIDDVYGDLYTRLKNGEKITIFFDPAHGKMDNGQWEGEATGRMSCTGLPEEYYSIQLSRKLYKLISKNKFFQIKSTADYMRVLSGKSDEYKKIQFSETIKLAKSGKALIIISEHLNNISSLRKADGLINLSGIHITCDEQGNRYLTNIKAVYNGFLTLYNKYDPTGLSKSIANKIKNILSLHEVKPNSWEYGAVADDRFSYFTDFPISVIFESGFISNPDEEKKLRNPGYQQKIVESHYRSILESFEEVFGIDISGFWARKTKNNDNTEITTLIKLTRIAIYYLQNDIPEKAINTITEIEKNYYATHSKLIEHFSKIKENIIKAEKYFFESKRLLRKNRYSAAKKNMQKALKIVEKESLYSTLKNRYSKNAYKFFKIRCKDNSNDIIPKIILKHNPEKASLNTPIIIAIEKGQAMEDAVKNALQPNTDTTLRLIESFNNAYIWKRVLSKKYSEKRKKMISYWKWKKIKLDFKEGLYIVKLNKKFRITHVKRVSQVLLDPKIYQNHQYLKNSYFANTTKYKSL